MQMDDASYFECVILVFLAMMVCDIVHKSHVGFATESSCSSTIDVMVVMWYNVVCDVVGEGVGEATWTNK